MKKVKRQMDFPDQSGQALFEFLAFIPLMLMLYSITITIGASINASINQQKIVRGYYYHLIQNSSAFPTKGILLDSLNKVGAQRIGFFALGWKTRFEGSTPVSPCYKLLTLSSANANETCEDRTPPIGPNGNPVTRFIRVKTAYGICGPSYLFTNGDFAYANDTLSDFSYVDPVSCLSF
jgi:hypothetical protein